MKKREFLAAGGAVPLMLAGCGGDSGAANVRLVNASIGYPALGFEVEDTQATSSDVAYGEASVFERVEAGSVSVTLTTTTNDVITYLTSTTRTLNKNTRYSLIGYGFESSPKSVLITENSQDSITSGYASVNVLNTSTDVGSVDIYLTASSSVSGATAIASSLSGVAQSSFTYVKAGTYYITVVGAGSVASGVSDVRFQSTATITLTDQQIITLILSPGVSGVLCNVLAMTQGDNGSVVAYTNPHVRLRAIAACGPSAGTVTVNGILSAVTSPNASDYYVLDAAADGSTAAPAVSVNGATLASAGNLTPGTDYTVLVYLDATSGSATTSLITDDNRLPSSSSDCKVRLINAIRTSSGTTEPLTLLINANSVASNIAYGAASSYVEIAVPTSVTSTIEVTSGFSTVIATKTITLATQSIYSEIVAITTGDTVVGTFVAARTTS